MLTSYHVHSTFSDGLNTIPELVQGAVDAGLDELGISDHYVFLPNGRTVCWSMPLSELDQYAEQVRQAAEAVSGALAVRLGLEADYDPETASELALLLQAHPFDYVIGSVHFVDDFCVDECRENWDELTAPERNDMMRAYWDRIARMAASGVFDFAGHLDLYKKFGHFPTVDISSDIEAALDAIARSGMAVELNTSGWYKPDIREAYPSPDIISRCRSRGIPMLICADAHRVQDLLLSFDRAVQALRDAGYADKAVYAGRDRRLVRL